MDCVQIQMKSEPSIFQRTELLLGQEALQRMASKRVIIFGVGGVGSWCAESLVRSGIHHLTIVDSDLVCTSNINRQLMATTLTVGRAKVEVMRERLMAINPNADIVALQRVFNEQTAASFRLDSYDYVIDAIDSLRDKALLILMATELGVGFYSSMGAAMKLDPTRIRVAEFRKVQGDPLARSLRKRFKHDGRCPQRPFMCVYSDELTGSRGPDDTHTSDNDAGHAKAYVCGTVVHITAIFGFTLAALVVQDIKRNGD